MELTNFIGSGGDHDGKRAVQESVMSSGGVRVTLTSQGSHATRLADPDLLHVLDRDGPGHACDLGSISSMTTLLQHVTPQLPDLETAVAADTIATISLYTKHRPNSFTGHWLKFSCNNTAVSSNRPIQFCDNTVQ